MRLDGLGKPPLAQVQSDSIENTKVQDISKEVNQVAEVGGARTTDDGTDREKGRLGQILDILQKAQERKKRKQNPKAFASRLSEAIRTYQRVAAGPGEQETQVGQTIDKMI